MTGTDNQAVTDKEIGEHKEEQEERHTNRDKDRWTDIQKHTHAHTCTDRHQHRPTGGQTEKPIDRTHNQTDTDWQTDK